jgi:hypothetical protein
VWLTWFIDNHITLWSSIWDKRCLSQVFFGLRKNQQSVVITCPNYCFRLLFPDSVAKRSPTLVGWFITLIMLTSFTLEQLCNMEWHLIGLDSALLLKLYSVLLYSLIFRLCVFRYSNTGIYCVNSSMPLIFFSANLILLVLFQFSVSVHRSHILYSNSCRIFYHRKSSSYLSSSYNPIRCIYYCFLPISPVSNFENSKTQMSIIELTHSIHHLK